MAPPSRILIVDDDTNILAMLGALLGKRHDLRLARNGIEAIRLAERDPPDLVLLDVEMPELDGYETCRRLKADPRFTDVPVIFLSSHTDESPEVRGLEAGATDFISKPPRGTSVIARVENMLRLKALTDRMRMEAMTDGLTGVANRLQFDNMLHQEWLRARRNGQPLALLLADVDLFKAYNDHYGHPAGDACLRATARAMQAALRRPGDLLARYGGEEFVMLLPDTDALGACKVATAVRVALKDAALAHAASSVADHVTLSVGVSAIDASCTGWSQGPPESESAAGSTFMQHAHDLIQAADHALYAAKAHGRDCAWFLDIGHADRRDQAVVCQSLTQPSQDAPNHDGQTA